MIQWTIPGNVANTTEINSSSYSYASSASGSESTRESGPFDGQPFVFESSTSGSQSSTEVSSGQVIVGASGRTTQEFYSFSSEAASASGATVDLTPEAQSFEGNNYEGPTTSSTSGSGSSSFSSSTESTAEFTASPQTSTTETYESGYQITVVGESSYFPWSTSSLGGTGSNSAEVVFFQNEEPATTTTVIAEDDTRVGTDIFVTQLEQTITLNGLPNTVVQADPGEIIYVIRSMPTVWNGYSAATEIAESGTRFTLSPSFVTISRPAMSASTPTSSTQIPSFSVGENYSVVTGSTVTITSASYFSFPPQTGTRTTNSFSLRSSSASVSSPTRGITYGSGTSTINQTRYFTVPTTVRRQTQSVTYAGSATTTSSLTDISTVPAAVTFTTSSGGGNESSGSTLYAEGNVIISAPCAVLGGAGNFGRTKYRTTGAVVGSQTGGWITANASSTGFFFGLYALAGSGRNGQAMLPQTNTSRTVDSSEITWTLSTSTTAEQGTTTAATTTSASFGVSGATSITLDNRPLSVLGGTPGAGQTIVERPGVGIYKDRINGTTSTFSEGDVSFTSGQSQPLRAWFPIRHIGPVALSGNLNPVTWIEPRNSTALPP
jgi:hypothetical protein